MFEGLLAPTHLIILAVVLVVVFGPKPLPEIGRSLGAGIREFKNFDGRFGYWAVGCASSSRTVRGARPRSVPSSASTPAK